MTMTRPALIPVVTQIPKVPVLTFTDRLDRKLRRVAAQAKRRIRRLTARAVFSLPVLSRHDPRRRVIRLRDHCTSVEEFPAGAARTGHDWHIKIRSAERIALRPSIAINENHAAAFAAGICKHQGGTTLELPDVFLAAVRNARIYSADFLLLSNENRIFFESALSRSDYLEANGILDTIRFPKPTRMDGEHCLLANRSIRGYYHWLIDILPKLSTIESFPQLDSIPLILPSKLQRFHKESLDLAGISPNRISPMAPGFVQVDRVYFPELLGPTGIPSPHAIHWLRSRFLEPQVPEHRPASRRVYLTRRDATQRRVLNEPEITSFLGAQGFEVICPGELSFREQVQLFREVSVVIAPHGAGMTNMVFAPPGATLIEFFGDNYINGCFWAIANLCRQRHAILVGPSNWLDYHISLDHLKKLLHRLDM